MMKILFWRPSSSCGHSLTNSEQQMMKILVWLHSEQIRGFLFWMPSSICGHFFKQISLTNDHGLWAKATLWPRLPNGSTCLHQVGQYLTLNVDGLRAKATLRPSLRLHHVGHYLTPNVDGLSGKATLWPRLPHGSTRLHHVSQII